MRHVCGSVLQSAVLVASVVVVGFVPTSAVAADCPNAAIRSAQGPAVEALPDCMALEMASPPKKFLQGAEGASVSIDGGRVLFWSRGALGDPPGMGNPFFGDLYIGTRGESGWGVEWSFPPVQPEGSLSRTWVNDLDPARSLDPQFSRWVTFGATIVQADVGEGRMFRGGLGGLFAPLSPLLVPVDGGHHGSPDVNHGPFFEGASADHSRVLFKPRDLDATYLAGDLSTAGAAAEGNSYVAALDAGGGPGLSLLARDWAGKIWGGRCGARLGGVVADPFSGQGSGRDQGAASPDGSRILFSTRPGQTGMGNCDGAANRLRVMRRVERPYGPEIAQLFSSECDRVAPACDLTDGDDLFQGASVDQTKVYFLSNRQLTDSDLDGGVGSGCQGFVTTGCDLYLYDSTRSVGDRLTQISAGDETNPTPGAGANVREGIAAISGDGSHVYFVANGVLTTDPSPTGTTATAGQPNLYLYQRDGEHPDGRIAFVGTASAADETYLWNALGTFKGHAYPVPATGTDNSGIEVGGDGHVLVFRSWAAFTSDDSDGGWYDVFRYDADSHELMRVSKAAAGGTDNQPVDVVTSVMTNPYFAGTAFAEIKRWVSEDGQTIAIRTSEDLVAGDANGITDDYVWQAGTLYRLPGTSGTSGSATPPQPALSHDGSTVAFQSFEQLLPADGDTVSDIYVARADGGFANETVPDDCAVLTDGCQGDGAGTVDTGSSTGDAGAGNVTAGDRARLILPALSARALRRAARRGVLAVPVGTTTAGTVTMSAYTRVGNRTKRVGRAAERATGPGMVIARVRLTRAIRNRLQSGSPVRVRLVARQTGARPRTRNVRLPGVGA